MAFVDPGLPPGFEFVRDELKPDYRKHLRALRGLLDASDRLPPSALGGALLRFRGEESSSQYYVVREEPFIVQFVPYYQEQCLPSGVIEALTLEQARAHLAEERNNTRCFARRLRAQDEARQRRGALVRSQREALELIAAQLAALTGLSTQHQEQIETGDNVLLPLNYQARLAVVGIDWSYACGGADEPQIGAPGYPQNPNFDEAVELFRRSLQVVDAFAGPGAARACPELVVALMTATNAASALSVGPGDLDDFGERVGQAIEDCAESLAKAVQRGR